MKKALITGITGQDGSYLARLLLEKGYEVWGTVRRSSTPEMQLHRLGGIVDQLHLESADLLDPPSLVRVLGRAAPDEVYNLAAQSDVKESFNQPVYTTEVISVGTTNLLEAVKQVVPHTRFFQASSSEMFGNSIDADGFQRETTPMNPVSPYGCAKVQAYHLTRHHRRAFDMFMSTAIFFNHESPQRGTGFVTNKFAKEAVRIKRGLTDKLEVGNLDASRDWGHAADVAEAVWLIMQQETSDDFVIATGESHTVRELCDYIFGKLGLDYKNHIKINEKYLRAEELHYLRGDATKLRTRTGWAPKHTFEGLLDEMVDYWLDRIPPLSSSTPRLGVATDIVLTETVSPPSGIVRPWEVLIQPEKPIPADKLEIKIASGDPYRLASRHPELHQRSVEYWQQANAQVRTRRQEDLAEAFGQGNQRRAMKLVSQVGERQKYRLSRAFLEGTTLYLGIDTVSYSDVLGTNDLAVHDATFREALVNAGLQDTANPDSYFANPLSICAVLYGMESEGRAPGTEMYIPLGLRSDKVHHYPGSVHVFGCHVEKREDRSLNPFDYLMDALEEKMGLDRSSVGMPVFYGLIRQQPSRVPELVVGIPLRVGKPELEQRWKDAPARYEHERLLFCTPEELGPFLKRNITTMVPAGAAALSYYLKNCA